MSRFSARNRSVAVVPTGVDALWAVLTDPSALAELTPLVAGIEAQGDRWSWTLVGVSALGVSAAPTFTERMTFEPRSRNVFAYDPSPGTASARVQTVSTNSSRLIRQRLGSASTSQRGWSCRFRRLREVLSSA